MIDYTVRFWEYDEVVLHQSAKGVAIPRIGHLIQKDKVVGRVTGVNHIINRQWVASIVIDAELINDESS